MSPFGYPPTQEVTSFMDGPILRYAAIMYVPKTTSIMNELYLSLLEMYSYLSGKSWNFLGNAFGSFLRRAA